MAFIYSIKDTYRAAVEASTGGKNTVIYDDKGNPSIMVYVPKMYLDDLIPGAPHELHPSCKVNGAEVKELWISKYQNVVVDSRAYSLPMQDPKNSINFDGALQACYAKGSGFHLMSNAEWAMVALLSKKKGTMPRGNNNFGSDIGASYERGKETYKETSGLFRTCRVASGSGPAAWTHDGTPEGIYDLNGNVWEWVSGMRLNEGEIQIIKDNDAAILNADHGVNSALWQAILQDGSLVLPGTADTLKYDAETATPSGIRINTSALNKTTEATSLSKSFETIAANAGVTIPTVLKALGLAPIDAAHGGDNTYLRNNGERFPFRGGSWGSGSSAGVFSLGLDHPRSNVNATVGFRSAYCVL